MTEPSNTTTPKLTRIERIRIEAKQEAEHLAEAFDLRKYLVDLGGLELDNAAYIYLTVVTRKGKGVEVELDSITEALQDFIRDQFAEEFAKRKIEELLNQESP
jgi:hypothetical protein